MKKLIGILSLCVALTGCSYQTVNSNDIETAQKICAKSNSSVVEIAAYFDGSGDGTLVLDTGDRRVSRKLALGQGAVQYVNNRNHKTFAAFRGKPWNTATFPTTDVGNYVRWLAGVHGVRYVPTVADHWAETVTRLAGDEVRSGPVQDLLVALKRAGKLTKEDMARLLVTYLRERKQGVLCSNRKSYSLSNND